VYTVDRLTDLGEGDGLAGDLRYCITQANAVPGDDTIAFDVTGTINLSGALPDLSSNIDLQGPGAEQLTVRRNTAAYYRIFTVPAAVTVSISDLTITNGVVNEGGGIWNQGSLTLNNATISGNGGGVGGGGIYNRGTLTLNNATVSRNGARDGGGIYNALGGSLTLNYATVSDNTSASYDLLGGGLGGGVYNGGTLTLNLRRCYG
jgi:hypothetical protein